MNTAFVFWRTFSVSLSVLLAVVITYYFSYSKEAWLVISALIISQVARDAPFRQGFFFLVTIMIGVGFASFLLHVNWRERMLESCMGSILGMIMGKFVFPRNIDKEFRAGVEPVLHYLQAYMDTFIKVLKQTDSSSKLDEAKIKIEYALQAASYPSWVYEMGFNPGLRAGLRFFLVHL